MSYGTPLTSKAVEAHAEIVRPYVLNADTKGKRSRCCWRHRLALRRCPLRLPIGHSRPGPSKLRRGKISPVERRAHASQRIEKLNPKITAYITRDGGAILGAGAGLGLRNCVRANRAALARTPSRLRTCSIRGIRTTCASAVFSQIASLPKDAEVVRGLKAAGAVIVGKANMHESPLARRHSSHFGAGSQPWDLDRIAGGSSGGSAASGRRWNGLRSDGTDTGGSIRGPASFVE